MTPARIPSPRDAEVAIVRIRAFDRADEADVIRLVEQILAEYNFSTAAVGSIREDLRTFEATYGGAGGGFWVAEHADEIIGTVAIRPKHDRTCELKRLYLRSDIRGSGVGQALYDHAERFARDAGYETIWLDSSRRFTRARRLYERNGFVLIDSVDNEWEDAVFEKRLA